MGCRPACPCRSVAYKPAKIGFLNCGSQVRVLPGTPKIRQRVNMFQSLAYIHRHAAELLASHADLVAQHPEERGAVIDMDHPIDAVDLKS